MINKSYQDVQVRMREEESLETLSEDREWLCRCDVERWNGRSFHMLALATGNARLPTAESRMGGTSRRWEVEDRSRRPDVMSATRVKHD